MSDEIKKNKTDLLDILKLAMQHRNIGQ